MSKKDSSQVVKRIKKEIEQVLTELRDNEYIRDENGVSDKQIGINEYEISYSGKTDKSSIVYVPSPKKQTKNLGKKPNEKNDKYNIKLLYPTAFIPRFA